ncbi:WAS/WASL-interacting protein family member 1-like [Phacochoerus africanus]|uniref:WAS/WASL-interacting protein family member 1-like n=1 Tax=Phacochoerus africanus TaxID=41426 RepID=UPI001FD9964D|nr:WAS/WASL-interacting protein family member 1-like [Phacochoerus africanus]
MESPVRLARGPPPRDRRPGAGDGPHSSSGSGAHRSGGRAGRGPRRKLLPGTGRGRGFPWSRARLPKDESRGTREALAPGPTPRHPAGLGLTQQHLASPFISQPRPYPAIFLPPPQFPHPRPSVPLPCATVHHTGRQPSRHLPPRLLLLLPPSAPCRLGPGMGGGR